MLLLSRLCGLVGTRRDEILSSMVALRAGITNTSNEKR